MANEEDKKNDACIYVISSVFCVFILAGGSCLALYIILPETTSTKWYAIIGMVLVGIPWAFWLLVCMYRCCTYPVPVNEKSLSNRKNSAPTAQAAAATTSSMETGISDSPVDSPGGRHVRFGAATVLGGQDSSSEDVDVAIETESENSHDEQERYHGTDTSSPSSFSNGGVSFTSHESEQPLTLSISS